MANRENRNGPVIDCKRSIGRLIMIELTLYRKRPNRDRSRAIGIRSADRLVPCTLYLVPLHNDSPKPYLPHPIQELFESIL